MHRRVVNEAVLALTLWPEGPVLIKAAEAGTDPTRPDVEFVRTRGTGGESVYLPGSSLKGVLRAHSERLARTLGGEAPDGAPRLSCNPLSSAAEGPNYACSARLRRLAPRELTGERVYRQSCFICQLFGNQALASHLRVADARPVGAVEVEQRASIAIDRIYGSAALGPFTYEAVTGGRFQTQITVRNFSLAQLGLLALVLRDLGEGRLFLGFGKSRGFGQVGVAVQRVVFRYPGCTLRGGALASRAGATTGPANQVYGAGMFPGTGGYGFPTPDTAPLPPEAAVAEDGWGTVEARLDADPPAALTALWQACVGRWTDWVQACVEGG